MKVPRQTLKGAEHPELFAPSCLRCVYTVWFYYGMQAGDVPKGTNFFQIGRTFYLQLSVMNSTCLEPKHTQAHELTNP